MRPSTLRRQGAPEINIWKVRKMDEVENAVIETQRIFMLQAVNHYLNALKRIDPNADEIDVITAILKGMGYEYHEGQGLNGEYPHFFIKDTDLIRVILEEQADEETLEAIRGDDSCGATKTAEEGNSDHMCVLEKGHEGEHRCLCDYIWGD